MNFEERVLNHEYFKQFDKEALIDPLTKMIRREYIIRYAKLLIAENKPFVLTFYDIDNFKSVNDSFGHHMGDRLLKTISNNLLEAIGGNSYVGRYGGDEFLIITEGEYTYEEKREFIKSIHAKTYIEYDINENFGSFMITATSGSASFPEDALTYDELLIKSDKALYRGKQKGRRCYIIYNEFMHGNIDVGQSKSADSTAVMLDRIYERLTDPVSSFESRLLKVIEMISRTTGISDIYYINPDKKVITLDKYYEDIPIKIVDLFKEEFPINSRMFINDTQTLLNDYPNIYNVCYENRYKAICIVPVTLGYDVKGVILAVDKMQKRLWLSDDLTFLTHTANIIGLYTNKDEIKND